MPILISSKRRARQIEIETKRNMGKKSRVHNARRTFMDSIDAKDHALASDAFKKYCSALDRAAKHNIIKKNTAVRRKKRAAAKLRAIA
jgi:small subunit ribosomal protein S20